MSAVTSKPRARKAPAASEPASKVGEWVEHINSVRSLVRQSLSLTSRALEKADYGKPAYTLLTCASAEYSTILRHLDLGPVSGADAQFLSDDGIWPALGMLAGAISLLENDPQEAALAPAVRDAHKALDAAHSGLDSAIVAEIGAPQVNVARRDFSLGRDLAIELLAAGDAMDNTDKAEAYRWMRGGAAQERFALPFLRRLLAEPELIEGFAAVLSARLGTGDHTAPDYYDLPMAEYEAGDVGADGTEVDTSGAKAPTATPPTAGKVIEVPQDDAERRLALAQESNHEVEKLAEGMIRLLEQNRDDDFLMYHGLLTRIQTCANITFFAMRLHGDTPQEEDQNWGDFSKVDTLERAYKGLM